MNRPKECRLCAAKPQNFNVAGKYVYGGKRGQKFYSCSACGIAFLYPAMSEERESNFYAKEFEKFMEKRTGKDFDWSGPEAHLKSNRKQYLRRLRFFENLLSPGKRVLEIGCSSGFMLLPLKERGLEVVGVEPSSGFRNFLKDKEIKTFDSIDALEKSKEAKNKFDLVIHFFVLEHVRNPVTFLRQGLSFLRTKGVMVFEVPSYDDPLITIYNIPAFQRFYWSVAHNYYFNKKSLKYVLKKMNSNFEIIPEQRYDISNHFTWALDSRPGGQERFSHLFMPELEKAYLDSMIKTGHCDTLIGKILKD